MGKALPAICLLALSLAGCSASEKSGSLWAVYGAAVFMAFAILAIYAFLKGKKDPWFFLLLGSVLVVNCGYLLLALSQTLSQALWANRLSYLGSVFLPLSMFMTVGNVAGLRRPKHLPALLIGLGIFVFLLAASPGILPVYYKEVSFAVVNGVGTLQKVYGPLHRLYYMYLLGYFGAMVAIISRGTAKKKIKSFGYSLILAIAVFVNIGVWLAEQFVKFQFELLSISYIISEFFLLGLHLFMAEMEKRSPPQEDTPAVDKEQLMLFREGLPTLTKKENAILDCYVEGLTTQEVLEKLQIKENTLKYHNKNLYGKLGVSGRKELLVVYKAINSGR